MRNANPFSIGISPDGTQLAVLEYGQGKGLVSVVDTATGQTQRLTWFEGAGGGEQVLFSPDGRWLLIPSPRGGYTALLIVSVATGQRLELNVTNRALCWWVLNGRLGVLQFGRGKPGSPSYDPYAVDFYDLTTDETVEITRVKPPCEMPEDQRYLFQPEANNDGEVLLEYWIPPAYPGHYKVHPVLGILDLATGNLQQIAEPFVEPQRLLRRRFKGWHWNTPLSLPITHRPAMLEAAMRDPLSDGWPRVDDYGGIIQVAFDGYS